MGLDVTAFRQLKKLDALFNEDGEAVNPATREPYEDYFQVYANRDFPAQARGLDDGAVYEYEESERFWSGGYGRYNNWREQLAVLAGYPPVLYERIPGYAPSAVASCQVGAERFTEGPFHELICFSDCDGTIGPVVSAKLAKDFADWDERAKATGNSDFYENFVEWRKCFEMAADGGAVSFH